MGEDGGEVRLITDVGEVCGSTGGEDMVQVVRAEDGDGEGGHATWGYI